MTTLIPIKKTQMARRITRNGNAVTEHKECWAAVTEDGIWSFERLEMTGTPWAVTHVPTATDLQWMGTLKGCRQYVTHGYAQADLDRIEAHSHGAHADQRDPRCIKC